LQSGAAPLMATKSIKACRVAQDEINQGRVTFVVSHKPEPEHVAPEPPEQDQ
jgi:DNA-directed RNA polymerase subunit omega